MHSSIHKATTASVAAMHNAILSKPQGFSWIPPTQLPTSNSVHRIWLFL